MVSRKILYLTAIIFICAPFRVLPDEDCELFLVLTTADTQTQLMALELTTQLTQDQQSVQILLCGAAGDIAFNGSEEVILKPINKSPRMILKSLIESGVTVQVCSLYMPNKGISAEELIDGVTQAKSPLVAKILLEHGVKVVTF